VLERIKSRWWYVYLASQGIGLFFAFYPLSYHVRHTVGRFAILPLVPGVLLAYVLDWVIRVHGWTTHTLPQMTAIDGWFIGLITFAINCVFFAFLILMVRWGSAFVRRALQARRNSWRKNANTFD
jgi:hypothetical protein